MYVRRLYIRNYRCFDDDPTIVEFSESGLTALIGPNNVGKSTILKVLEILLGDKWPSGQFNADDFHNNELNREITLACEFSDSIPVNIYGTDYNILGVTITARHIQSGYGESSVEIDYFLIDNISNFQHAQWNLVTYKGDRPIRVSQDAKNHLPVVITIPLIKLHSEQPSNKWGVLGRMLQKVERVFSSDQTKETEFKDKMKEAVKILRGPQDFVDIEADIKDFWDKMKPTNLSGTNLEFLDYEPWRYYRQFKLAIKRKDHEVPIETLGEGVQRLAVIALYRTYLKRHGRNERAILLIEEPESYLHPQARGTLFSVLKQAIKEESNVEGQIIYTTHSEDFIDCGDFDDIVIFAEKQDGVEVRHIMESVLRNHTLALGYTGQNISDPHIHYRLLETVTSGLKEALFAHRAIIVEGPSEIELLRFFTEVEKDQIAVVSVDGKSNIPSVYSFLTAFGVPCLVIIDRDEENAGENQKIVSILTESNALHHDSLRMDIREDEIKSVQEGEIFTKNRLLIFGKNLEAVLHKQVKDYADLLSKLRDVFCII